MPVTSSPRSVEPRPPLESITLLTTFKCNIACKHCGYRSSPRRTEVIDLDMAKDAIRTAKEAGAGLVAFTGGEPFLFQPMLRELVQYAQSHGLPSAVVTNCFWATSPDKATAVLSALAEDGLVDFTTSFDWFHLEFLDVARIRNGLHAAVELGMRCHVNVVVTREGAVCKSDVCEMLELDPEWIGERGFIEVKELSPVPVGHAEDYVPDKDFLRYDERWLIGRPCYFALRNPVVSTTGDVYGCCGFGGGTDTGPSELLKIGSMRERPLDELIADLRGNLLFNMIASVGPNSLIEMVKERWPGTLTRGDYVFNCEACQEISRNPTLKKRIGQLLRELSEEARASDERDQL
ncbi:MAG: radical SAM protein [Deltaproteobacteria bacterium]|nr:radical SAM protein [Deltaproteobacteria bacterium]